MITTTSSRPEGSLKVSFSTTKDPLVQGDVWEVGAANCR